MPLILLAKYWQYAVIALLSVILLISGAALAIQSKNIEQLKTDHQLELASMQIEHQENSLKIERQGYENTVKAINESKKREQIIIADAADARDAVSRLSGTIESITTAAASDAKYSAAALANTGNLLKECSGEYIAMAETADRISNDLQAIQQASRK